MRFTSKKTAMVLALAAVFLFAVCASAFAAPPWSDASNTWWVANYGVTAAQVGTVAGGFPDGTFRPAQAVTRGQFAKMAVSGLSLPTADPVTATFKDVAKGSTFYTFVEGAYAQGLISGYSTASGLLFKPSDDISRQQTNSILGRYLSEAEIEATGVIHGVGSLTYASLDQWYAAEGAFYLNGFLDSGQVAADHRATTAYLVYHQVVEGSNGRLNPTATLNRAQAAVMVLRVAAAAQTMTTPPLAPTGLTVTPASPGNDSTPRVSGATIPGGLVHVYDNGGTTSLAEATANSAGNFYADITAPLADGSHSFTAKVKNSGGLVSQASSPVSYLLDTVAPTGTITAPTVPASQPDAALSTGQPTFTATAADALSGVKQVEFQYAVRTGLTPPDSTSASWLSISIDNTSPYAAAWPTTLTLDDGQYWFRVVVTDLAGNITYVTPVAVTVDTTPPVVSITSPVAVGAYHTDSPTPLFTATAVDNPKTVSIQASGMAFVEFLYAPWNGGSTSTSWADPAWHLISSDDSPAYGAAYSANGIPDGHYLFAVRATDRAGNQSLLMQDSTHYMAGVTQEVVIDPPAAPVIGTASDPDGVIPGIDGRDFHVTWTPSTSTAVVAQDIYILPHTSALNLAADTAVATISDGTTSSWTGTSSITADSLGAQFDPTQAYDVYVVARKANQGEAASGPAAWPSAAPAAATGLTASDNDTTVTGVDGRDFSATWTPSVSPDVIRQYVYILPAGDTLNPAAPTAVPPPTHLVSTSLEPAVVADQPVDYIANNSTGPWTGDSTMTTDSRGSPLGAGSYTIWIGAVSDDLRMTLAESAPFTVASP